MSMLAPMKLRPWRTRLERLSDRREVVSNSLIKRSVIKKGTVFFPFRRGVIFVKVNRLVTGPHRDQWIRAVILATYYV